MDALAEKLLWFLVTGFCVLLYTVVHLRERRREKEQRQEEIRERDAARQSIPASGLECTDDVWKAVFHWLQRHEGETVKVQRGKPEDCLCEKYIEWTIPRFEVEVDMKGRRRAVYSFKAEYGGSVNWKFPPEPWPDTWHEADVSDDRLVYSIGRQFEPTNIGYLESSVTARSEVNEWSHWSLTAQTPKSA